jgi:asparagine synthase (glutamine-hydrolysing)
MCGIAGRVNRSYPVSRTQLAAMSELIAHRGPDGEGRFQDARVGLAHRRLAIVDVNGGQQPVSGERGRTVLVYNGEVYNHQQLRATLEGRGHVFHTRCDTEAVLHAHEEWGVAAAARLRGMFAYAAWDSVDRTLTLVRDRLGIKPLYYALLPSGDLMFASELKALLVEPAVDRTLDEEALGCYLTLRYVPGPATIVRGVRKLEPGCALVWHDGRVDLRRFWQVPSGDAAECAQREAPAPPPTYVEGAGRLTTLLDEAIGTWRMSDVPLGAFLSGGLDSTLVAAVLARMARAAGDPTPRTFSVGYSGPGAEAADELSWARMAAAALGTAHREIAITGEQVAEELPRIAWHLDEPMGDPASVPLWFVAQRARAEVTVVLSGEGADEVFAGYAIHRRRLQIERLRATPWLARLVSGAARTLSGVARTLSGLAGRPLDRGFAARLQRVGVLLGKPLTAGHHGIARAFEDDLLPRWADRQAVARALAPAWARVAPAPTLLARLLGFDQQAWLADDILLKGDKMTMAHGLELRPPLLDHRLVEEVAAWPDRWKLDGRVGKRILRLAAAGLVPRPILERRKIGFAAPHGAWLRTALEPMTRELLLGSSSLAVERGSAVLVADLLAEHARGRDRGAELWALLALELWRRTIGQGVATVSEAGTSYELAG